MNASDHNATVDQHHAHGSAREHGHGYTDQEPSSWLPGAILDAEIFVPAVLDQLQQHVEIESPRTIADIGCGPGVGTLELAKRFPKAAVFGLDIGEAALEIAVERAQDESLAERVTFVRADFEHDMTDKVEPMDLVFASMSLHHTQDPAVALGNACAVARPGGRVVVAEFGRPLAIWPPDHRFAPVWSCWQAAIAEARMEHLGEAAALVDWTELVPDQPVDQVEFFEFELGIAAPLAQRERSWLLSSLTRGLGHNGHRMDAQDRAELEALLDSDNPTGFAQSNEVLMDLSRTVFTGVRRTD